jgi:hypothetical protein
MGENRTIPPGRVRSARQTRRHRSLDADGCRWRLECHRVTVSSIGQIAYLLIFSRTFSCCVRAPSIHEPVSLSRRSHGTLAVAHIYFRASHSRWLTIQRLPTTVVDGSFLWRYSRNTNNQAEVAFADRPGLRGWIPEQGGPQMRLPAELPRLPKRASRAP